MAKYTTDYKSCTNKMSELTLKALKMARLVKKLYNLEDKYKSFQKIDNSLAK